MTKASDSSHPTAVASKSLCTSTRFPAGSADRKQTYSSPTNSRSMERAARKRRLLHSLANGRHRLKLRGAAIFPSYSQLVSWSFSLVLSPLADSPLRSSRYTLSPASLPSSPTHSINPQPYGIDGEPRKARCIYSPFSVAGPAPWPRSDCFGTNPPRRRFKPRFGSPLCSIAEHSAGFYRPQALKLSTLWSVPCKGEPRFKQTVVATKRLIFHMIHGTMSSFSNDVPCLGESG